MFSKLLGKIQKKFYDFAFETMLPNFEDDFKCDRVFMLAELPGNEEDWHGNRRKGKIDLGNTFSWNRFFRKPLVTKPETLADIETFLKSCEYLSDMETRGCVDYWEPPDVFELRKTGDCEDHAIWAWRHLHEMGFKVRLVLGDCKGGHAWVHIYVNGRAYLLEATQKKSMLPLVKRYTPYWSVQRTRNRKFSFYKHSSPEGFSDWARIAFDE